MTINFLEIARENGFLFDFITKEEREDGIGVTTGWNFMKDEIWYTPQECANILKLGQFKHTSIIIDTISRVEAILYVLSEAQAQGVKVVFVTSACTEKDGTRVAMKYIDEIENKEIKQ